MAAVESDMGLLHPIAAVAFNRLAEALMARFLDGSTKTRFRVFETLRSHARQIEMVKRKASKAGPWHSAHQYGLAVDFVPKDDGKWSWHENHDWEFLKQQAPKFGLRVPYSWDKVHVEHPAFEHVRRYLL